jgi:hypothetical protein
MYQAAGAAQRRSSRARLPIEPAGRTSCRSSPDD